MTQLSSRLCLLPGRSARRSVLRRPIVLLTAAALLVAACGSDGDDADSGDADSAQSVAESTTTSTAPPTTTTTRPPTTTTTEAPADPAPLTGLPFKGEPEALQRSPLAVKIDNHPNARPQVGIGSADIVFDLRAEGVTRFMAVFHSEIPSAVGPVRSSRTSDFDLLRGLDHPLYASSGGNANVMRGVAELPVFAVTNHTRTEYYRDGDRPPPHNLFIDPSVLYDIVGDDAIAEGAPAPWFDYRGEGDALPAGAVQVESVEIDFKNSPTVDFVWDPDRAGWLRSQDGVAHLDAATGVQVAPENVVIMVTTYGVSSADPSSPEVRSVGSGDAVVLTDGHRIDGVWERVDAAAKPVLVAASGEPIALTPGRTWVLYPEAGQIS